LDNEEDSDHSVTAESDNENNPKKHLNKEMTNGLQKNNQNNLNKN